jgi:hypothetical protein
MNAPEPQGTYQWGEVVFIHIVLVGDVCGYDQLISMPFIVWGGVELDEAQVAVGLRPDWWHIWTNRERSF